MEKVEIRGYTDPRTGEYKRTTEQADESTVHEDLAFIVAWQYYWNGPMSDDKVSLLGRETWLTSAARQAWLDDLTEDQRQMLADCPPPEEVPGFVS